MQTAARQKTAQKLQQLNRSALHLLDNSFGADIADLSRVQSQMNSPMSDNDEYTFSRELSSQRGAAAFVADKNGKQIARGSPGLHITTTQPSPTKSTANNVLSPARRAGV